MGSTPAAEHATEPRLAVWEFAGLLVTYWCNARCAFCYVYSGPDRGGEMSIAQALSLWRSLDRQAARSGHAMRVHLAGGEPFGDWPRLAGLVRAARDAGLSPLEKVETNAFWATQDGLTRARLELLAALGMQRLMISADVYHQEFVPVERVARCVRIARDVLGRGCVRVRWWDFLKRPAGVRGTPPDQRRAAYAAALARHRDRLTGRAAERLAGFFPRFPAEQFVGHNCVREVLQSRHVHIDAYGHVFPGVCSGIILGTAGPRSVEEVWDELDRDWRNHPVVAPLVDGGSFRLMQVAQAAGYQELADGYANKCHLCTHVRQFLHERGGWEPWIGPSECYANARDHAESKRWRGDRPLPILSTAESLG